METKILEIRDDGTFIPVLCVNMNPTADMSGEAIYYLTRVGYPCDGRPNILMTNLAADGSPAWNDSYAWGGRTRPVAHNYIIENWTHLKDGDVVDVEYILGERELPKISERFA